MALRWLFGTIDVIHGDGEAVGTPSLARESLEPLWWINTRSASTSSSRRAQHLTECDAWEWHGHIV